MVEEAISYLFGAAEQWHTDEDERERIRSDATWAQWKTAFIGKYVEVETAMELLESLLQVHQEKGESVDEYGTRVKDLVRKVGREASTGVVLVVFKKGLLPSYQKELEKSEYKTLDEALSIVTKKERMTKIERKAIIEEKSVAKDDVDKLADKLDKMKLRLMHAEAVAKKNNACYKCFEPGHTSSECPSRTGRRTIKKFEKEKQKSNGELRRMDADTGNFKADQKFIELEIDQEELMSYVEFDEGGEIRILGDKRSIEDEESGPEPKKLKLRIPTEIFKKKQELDAERKNWNKGEGFAPRTFNLQQKISTMSSGMTLAQAIEECPRIRNQMRQFCDSKHEARTIVAEPTAP